MPEFDCWHCEQTFDTGDELVDHLSDEGFFDDVTRGVVRLAGR